MGKRKEFSVELDLPDRDEMTSIVRSLTKEAAEAKQPLIMVNRQALLVIVCMATLWLEETG